MSDEATNPWSLYWQGGSVDSCIASASADDRALVSADWQALARSLPAGAAVLDLATGNGAVPRDLLSVNPALKVTGVDLAKIAPDRLLASEPALARVTFRGGVDICQLPFGDDSFDAVTSQFGLEYAPIVSAVDEASRVLRPGGRLQLLLHHSDSAVVTPSLALVDEINRLFSDGGLLATLNRFIAGDADLAALEQAGQAYLAAPAVRTRHISGQIMQGINQVIVDLEQQRERALLLAETMQSRLAAERSRLLQLQAAALDDAAAQALEQQLVGLGYTAIQRSCLQAPGDPPAIIGWQLSATRKQVPADAADGIMPTLQTQ
jgi:ubiquinone/menaquinone biosynthesis C-methylase UbiE